LAWRLAAWAWDAARRVSTSATHGRKVKEEEEERAACAWHHSRRAAPPPPSAASLLHCTLTCEGTEAGGQSDDLLRQEGALGFKHRQLGSGS
jgi:hypothetical protein